MIILLDPPESDDIPVLKKWLASLLTMDTSEPDIQWAIREAERDIALQEGIAAAKARGEDPYADEVWQRMMDEIDARYPYIELPMPDLSPEEQVVDDSPEAKEERALAEEHLKMLMSGPPEVDDLAVLEMRLEALLSGDSSDPDVQRAICAVKADIAYQEGLAAADRLDDEAFDEAQKRMRDAWAEADDIEARHPK